MGARNSHDFDAAASTDPRAAANVDEVRLLAGSAAASSSSRAHYQSIHVPHEQQQQQPHHRQLPLAAAQSSSTTNTAGVKQFLNVASSRPTSTLTDRSGTGGGGGGRGTTSSSAPSSPSAPSGNAVFEDSVVLMAVGASHKTCMRCAETFSTWRRRQYHCRQCGNLFCDDCCPVMPVSSIIGCLKIPMYNPDEFVKGKLLTEKENAAYRRRRSSMVITPQSRAAQQQQMQQAPRAASANRRSPTQQPQQQQVRSRSSPLQPPPPSTQQGDMMNTATPGGGGGGAAGGSSQRFFPLNSPSGTTGTTSPATTPNSGGGGGAVVATTTTTTAPSYSQRDYAPIAPLMAQLQQQQQQQRHQHSLNPKATVRVCRGCACPLLTILPDSMLAYIMRFLRYDVQDRLMRSCTRFLFALRAPYTSLERLEERFLWSEPDDVLHITNETMVLRCHDRWSSRVHYNNQPPPPQQHGGARRHSEGGNPSPPWTPQHHHHRDRGAAVALGSINNNYGGASASVSPRERVTSHVHHIALRTQTHQQRALHIFRKRDLISRRLWRQLQRYIDVVYDASRHTAFPRLYDVVQTRELVCLVLDLQDLRRGWWSLEDYFALCRGNAAALSAWLDPYHHMVQSTHPSSLRSPTHNNKLPLLGGVRGSMGGTDSPPFPASSFAVNHVRTSQRSSGYHRASMGGGGLHDQLVASHRCPGLAAATAAGMLPYIMLQSVSSLLHLHANLHVVHRRFSAKRVLVDCGGGGGGVSPDALHGGGAASTTLHHQLMHHLSSTSSSFEVSIIGLRHCIVLGDGQLPSGISFVKERARSIAATNTATTTAAHGATSDGVDGASPTASPRQPQATAYNTAASAGGGGGYCRVSTRFKPPPLPIPVDHALLKKAELYRKAAEGRRAALVSGTNRRAAFGTREARVVPVRDTESGLLVSSVSIHLASQSLAPDMQEAARQRVVDDGVLAVVTPRGCRAAYTPPEVLQIMESVDVLAPTLSKSGREVKAWDAYGLGVTQLVALDTYTSVFLFGNHNNANDRSNNHKYNAAGCAMSTIQQLAYRDHDPASSIVLSLALELHNRIVDSLSDACNHFSTTTTSKRETNSFSNSHRSSSTSAQRHGAKLHKPEEQAASCTNPRSSACYSATLAWSLLVLRLLHPDPLERCSDLPFILREMKAISHTLTVVPVVTSASATDPPPRSASLSATTARGGAGEGAADDLLAVHCGGSLGGHHAAHVFRRWSSTASHAGANGAAATATTVNSSGPVTSTSIDSDDTPLGHHLQHAQQQQQQLHCVISQPPQRNPRNPSASPPPVQRHASSRKKAATHPFAAPTSTTSATSSKGKHQSPILPPPREE